MGHFIINAVFMQSGVRANTKLSSKSKTQNYKKVSRLVLHKHRQLSTNLSEKSVSDMNIKIYLHQRRCQSIHSSS